VARLVDWGLYRDAFETVLESLKGSGKEHNKNESHAYEALDTRA